MNTPADIVFLRQNVEAMSPFAKEVANLLSEQGRIKIVDEDPQKSPEVHP